MPHLTGANAVPLGRDPLLTDANAVPLGISSARALLLTKPLGLKPELLFSNALPFLRILVLRNLSTFVPNSGAVAPPWMLLAPDA